MLASRPASQFSRLLFPAFGGPNSAARTPERTSSPPLSPARVSPSSQAAAAISVPTPGEGTRHAAAAAALARLARGAPRAPAPAAQRPRGRRLPGGRSGQRGARAERPAPRLAPRAAGPAARAQPAGCARLRPRGPRPPRSRSQPPPALGSAPPRRARLRSVPASRRPPAAAPAAAAPPSPPPAGQQGPAGLSPGSVRPPPRLRAARGPRAGGVSRAPAGFSRPRLRFREVKLAVVECTARKLTRQRQPPAGQAAQRGQHARGHLQGGGAAARMAARVLRAAAGVEGWALGGRGPLPRARRAGGAPGSPLR